MRGEVSAGGRRAGVLRPLVLAGLVAVALAAIIWHGRSEPAVADSPASFTVERDISYGVVGNEPRRNMLDVYTPRRLQGRAPVVVWIHGGGWYQGSKSSVVALKAERFTRAGYVFVAVNYRLSPAAGTPRSLSPGRVMFPDHPRDVARAIGWVHRNIGRYGGDRSRMVLAGHSAGAQTASLIATDGKYLEAQGVPPSRIKGVISLDAVGFDVTDLADPMIRVMTVPARQMYWNAFGTPAENQVDDRWRRASPLLHADRADPPFMFVVPTTIPRRIREAVEMSNRLGQRPGHALWRVDFDHREINHAFGARWDASGETSRAIAFTRAVTDPRPVLAAVIGKSRVGLRSGTDSRTVMLRMGSRPAGAKLSCRLDNGPWRLCSGREVFRVTAGPHRVQVRAYDFTGRLGPVTGHRFRVISQ